jgi:hypothetical protein
MSFDFEAAVNAPFRMQPGLQRMPAGSPHLSPLQPGSRCQREKLAVLSAFAGDALLTDGHCTPDGPARRLAAHAAKEHPDHLQWDGRHATAPMLACSLDADTGSLSNLAPGAFGLGDEITRCLAGLAPVWRLAGLLSLAFAEDFALLDGPEGVLPWLAVCLPSHWAPRDKVGRPFTEVHAPVADNALLLRAAQALVATVTGPQRWQRTVWTLTPHPRLHAHPDRVPPEAWALGHPAPRFDPGTAWFRTEHQTFIPLPDRGQALFTIRVEVEPLAQALAAPSRAQRLAQALDSMSEPVLAYRGLAPVHGPLLRWLRERAAAAA